MKIVFFDDQSWDSLLPLTFTRPVAELRIGIMKISEKWMLHFRTTFSYQTQTYLRHKFPFQKGTGQLYINGSVCPNLALLNAVNSLKADEALMAGDLCIAAKPSGDDFSYEDLQAYKKVVFDQEFLHIVFPEDIFTLNAAAIRADFDAITAGRESRKLSDTNLIIGDDIFVEEGVEAECCTFNTKTGPIYLGKNSQVWEGAHIRGALALCDNSQIKMGAKIYGATTIGPCSRVGGEIKNAVILGNTSKGHEGYLGDSVIGEWCNFGADTNNSNLKNNFAEVKLWNYKTKASRNTGLQFCGLIMADHVKCGINTMFNTGTVVGVGANVFGSGYPPTFIPDFSWGGAEGFKEHRLAKMLETAERVFARKNKEIDEIERDLLFEVYNITEVNRLF